MTPAGLDDLLPENQLSDEVVESLGRLVQAVNESEVWTLDLKQHAAGLFRSTDRIHGRIIRSTSDGEQIIAVTVTRDGTCENRVRLEPETSQAGRLRHDWPEGYRLLNLVIGEFRFFEFAPFERTITIDREPAAAAAPADNKPDGRTSTVSSRQLAAESTAPESATELCVDVQLNRHSCYLHVGVELPPDCESEFVVVELVRADTDEVLLDSRVLHLHQPDFKGKRYGKLDVAPLGAALNESFAVRVRPLTARDLHRLSAGGSSMLTQEFLAEQQFVTVPAERDGAAFAITPAWPDQAAALHDPSRQWALQVTRAGQKG